jgi:hypothetical protein
VRGLLAERSALGATDEELEVDLERLHGRLDVLSLQETISSGRLPEITTQHKAVLGESCRFMAPAQWCAPAADVPGKLFLTDDRLRFVGGTGVTLRWSAVARVTTVDRDLLVLPVGGGEPRRFRCNSYGDTYAAALWIGHLTNGRTGAGSG